MLKFQHEAELVCVVSPLARECNFSGFFLSAFFKSLWMWIYSSWRRECFKDTEVWVSISWGNRFALDDLISSSRVDACFRANDWNRKETPTLDWKKSWK